MNRATKIIVSTTGILLGISGLNHGIFETLQGFTPVSALIFQSIGEANRMWLYGFEDAFTVIPNYMITGIIAILLSIAVMIWSAAFVHKKNGSFYLIVLFILLFITGGGIGQILFFLPLWIISNYINSPLTWWEKVLPEKIRIILAGLWPVFLTIVSIMFLTALEIAVFGIVPGISNPEHKLFISWSIIAAALIMFTLTFIAGFADDIQQSYSSDI